MTINDDIRLIPILTIINGELVKTMRFQNPSYVGDPLNAVRIFNEKLVDELILLDIGNDRLLNKTLIEEVAGECFMPLTYGGKIRTLHDAESIFALGVEKISINGLLFENPTLINELINEFGSSSIVLSLDFKKKGNEYYVLNKKKNTYIDFKSLKTRIFDLEVGELLITSIEREGTLTQPDYELVKIFENHKLPIVYNGGVSKIEQIQSLSKLGLSGIASGAYLVYYGPHRAVLIHYPKKFENE